MQALRSSWAVALLLWCAVLASAVGAVWTRHRARELFVELERLNREHEELDVTWGRLQLEQSSFSAHANVEAQAVRRLQMRVPDPESVRLVLP